jgi:hypothetical protein
MARFYGGRSPYLVKNFRHFRFLAQSFYKGLQGEEAVSKELSRLSSDYTVFRGMNTLYGDVDFIVIGPTGIFVVEAKHWSGKIGLDRHGFLQDGNPTPDALGQIRVASALIQRLLRENREGHVKASPYARLFRTDRQIHVPLRKRAGRGGLAETPPLPIHRKTRSRAHRPQSRGKDIERILLPHLAQSDAEDPAASSEVRRRPHESVQ